MEEARAQEIAADSWSEDLDLATLTQAASAYQRSFDRNPTLVPGQQAKTYQREAATLFQVIQARSTLEAAETNRGLLRATWVLVIATLIVAGATIAVAIVSAGSVQGPT